MRTRINCGWLVGHDHGRHTLWRDAELVYEGNTVVFVGGKQLRGYGRAREIDARDKLSGARGSSTPMSIPAIAHRTGLISDVGRGDYFGQPLPRASASRARAPASAAIRAMPVPTTTRSPTSSSPTIARFTTIAEAPA